jgi:predicted nucleic acid-binding protein
VIAALAAWHERHEQAAHALARVTALPAHVLVEVYSVLTRLPSGLAVPAATAAATIQYRFADPPLRVDDDEELLTRLAGAGVFGGASYDGLVALEAAAHGRTLLTLDERARLTYHRLGVPFDVL